MSNDNYRDLAQESNEFKKVVEDRILMYSFVSDRFMPPDDPLGRSGPTLENFLRVQPKKGDLPPPCPYGKKCTYGTKCKFNHPERGSGPHKSVSERLSEHAQRHLSAVHGRTPIQGKSLSVPLNAASGDQCKGSPGAGGESLRKALCRTRSNVVPAESGAQHYAQYPGPYGGGGAHCSQQLQPPGCGWAGGATDPQQQAFPKSHSVESLEQQQRSMWPRGGPGNVSPNSGAVGVGASGGGPGEDVDGGVNLHRKLHRQLTLNPGGCDPRIYQIQRGMCPQGAVNASGSSPHRPLEPSRSSHCGQTPWDMQQQHHHLSQHQVSRSRSRCPLTMKIKKGGSYLFQNSNFNRSSI